MVKVIHVGFPKCASTFIQESLLPSINDLNYIDMHPVIEHFQSDDAFYDKEFFKNEIKKQLVKDKINIISSEYIVNYFLHWSRSFERLAELYPKAKILIVIRNQTDFFSSYYQEKIRGGAGYSFDNFVKSYCRINGALNACKYIKIINKLKKKFPEVRIELYETMFKNKGLPDLCEFLGSKNTYKMQVEKVNAKYSPLSHYITFLINKLQPTKIQGFEKYRAQKYFRLYLSPLFDKIVSNSFPDWKIKIPEETREFINEFYSESNKELQKLFTEDIRKLGYYF